MTFEKTINALNQTAKDLQLTSWIEVKDAIFVPQALQQISAVLFAIQLPENENTKIIRAQFLNLIRHGRLIFENE